MSSTNFTPEINTTTPFNRWDIPVKMGLLIGVLNILLTTMNNMLVLPRNYVAYIVITFVIGIVTVVLYGVTGARQRKAMGGYISLKEAFSIIFVTILISSAISTAYSIIYMKWIDPHVGEKVKDGTLAMMERFKAPQDKLDEAAANFDKQLVQSQKPAQLLLSYLKGVVFLSIFGFICAAIVKRAPKAAEMR